MERMGFVVWLLLGTSMLMPGMVRGVPYSLRSRNLGPNTIGLVNAYTGTADRLTVGGNSGTFVPLTFNLVPALNGDPNAISLEPIEYPGTYVHPAAPTNGAHIVLDTPPADTSSAEYQTFATSASFFERVDKYFSGFSVFESVALPNYNIHHASYVLSLYETTSVGRQSDSSFAVDAECGGGDWADYGGDCYIAVQDSGIALANAEAGCDAMGGTGLASIHSVEQNTFLHGLMMTEFDGVESQWTSGYIIGLNRIGPAIDSDFEWSDGSTVDYTNWNTQNNEPDVGYPHHGKMTVDGTWEALPNENYQYGYFCQKLYTTQGTADEAAYTCAWDGESETAQIVVTITPKSTNQYEEVWAGNVASYGAAECVRTIPAGTSIGASSEFTFHVTLANPECDVTDASQDGSQYTLILTTMTSSHMVMDTDYKYSIVCDFSSATNKFQIRTADGAHQNAADLATSSGTDNTFIPSTTLELLDSSGNLPNGGFDMGTAVMLRAMLDYADQDADYKSMRLTNCIAYSEAIDPTKPNFKIIGNNGCGTTKGEIFAADVTHALASDDGAGTTTAETPGWPLFAFINSAKNKLGNGYIFLECDIELCPDSATAPCNKPCDRTEVFRRKRRQADNDAPPSEGRVVAFIRVGPPGTFPPPNSNRTGLGPEVTLYTGDGANGDCPVIGYMVGLGVLALLLLLTLALAIVFFYKNLQHQHHRSEKEKI